jgi:MYXO-CTERM domain-containing protein
MSGGFRVLPRALCLAWVASAAASGQTGVPPAAGARESVVDSRGRALAHRATRREDEPRILGLADEAAPGASAGNATHGPASVEREEHRSRVLALYGGQPVRRMPEPDALRRRRAPSLSVLDEGAESGAGSIAAWAMIGVVALVALCVRSRRRRDALAA